MPAHRPALLAATLLASLAASAAASEPVNEPAEWFANAGKRLAEGDQARAVDRFKAIVRHHAKSPWAPKAQLEVARLLARNRELQDAFEAAQVIVEKYAGSDAYLGAIEVQFGVAERVAEEYRRRRLKRDKSENGLPSRESASEMLRIILAGARYTEHAPRAQYRLAVSLDEEGKPAEAVAEFYRFCENYPEHSLADDAAFQVAFIDFRQSRSQNRERAAQERARLALEDFMIRHPQSEKMPEARHIAGVLREWEGERMLVAARYYERTGKPGPALRTYREALQASPSMPQASAILERVRELEAQVGVNPAPHEPTVQVAR